MIDVTVALVSYLVFMATTKLLRLSVRWLNIRYDTKATVTSIIGDASNMLPHNLARQLSSKTKRQVYVSCDLEENTFIETMQTKGRQIFDDITNAIKFE